MENAKSLIRLSILPICSIPLLKAKQILSFMNDLPEYEIIKRKERCRIFMFLARRLQAKRCLYLHNKNKDLIPKLAAAISDMKKDGTIKKITDQTLEKFRK